MHCRRCSGASTRTAATAFAFAFAFLVSFSSSTATATATANACSAESDCYPEGAETHEEESEEEEWGWADIEYCINEDCADQKTNCFGDAQCKQLFNAVASREDGADGEPRYPTDVELGQSELLDGLFRCYAAKCDNDMKDFQAPSAAGSSSSSSSNEVDESSMSHRTYSDDGGVLIKLREGGCFDNLKYGKADRINLGESPDAVACAGKVITANRNGECSIYFEFDTKTGFCGCGAVGGNECKGDTAAVGRTSAVYQLSGPSPSCPTTLPGGAALPVQGARLKRLPNSGMLYASTRKAFDKTFELAALSVLRWAAAKGDAVKAKLQRKLAHMAVTYIMTTSGEKRDTGMFLDLASTPEFDAVTGIARVLPKRMTDHVDDKRNYGRLAKQAGVEGTDSAVPRTFESTADAVKVLSADPAACKYVFIKDVHGSGGTGISVRRTADLKDIKIGPHQIIQEGVTKVVLVEGRSLKIRTFLVVYCGKLYLSRYWSAFKGSSLYDPDKAESEDDLNRQLVSQHFNHSMSKKDYWKANGGRMLIAEDAPLRKEWTAAIATATTMMAPVFDTIVAATTNDPYRYHVLGLDAIVREESEEYSVQIIEANPFPNLTPNHDGPGREGVGERSVDGTTSEVRVIASVLRLLFGMETEDLIELLPASSA